MPLRRISILGVGLLGGSIALAARRAIKDCHVIGYAHREQTLQSALGMGVLDEGFDNPTAAVQDADLVILCTPVGHFRQLLEQIAPALNPATIVTDVGSTKRSVVAAAESILANPGQFVGSHPMAGSEKRGVAHARLDLLDGALCILTPTERTAIGALEATEHFWKTLGMRTARLSPDVHDQRLAEVSHLPHALAAALLMSAQPDSLPLAGKGLADLTRIAGGDAGLWRDILQDNRDAVRESLEKLMTELRAFSGLLEQDQSEALYAWLEQAARRRTSLTAGQAPADRPKDR